MGLPDLPPELQLAILAFLTRRQDIHNWIGASRPLAVAYENSRSGLILACNNKYGVEVDCENPEFGFCSSPALFRSSLYVRRRETEWTMNAARRLFANCLYCEKTTTESERANAYAVVRAALEYLDESPNSIVSAQSHETSLDLATATLAAAWAREEYMEAAKDASNPSKASLIPSAMVSILRSRESPTSPTSRYWAEEHLLWIVGTDEASGFAQEVLDRIIAHESFRSHATQEWAARSYKLIRQHGSPAEAKKFAKGMLDRILQFDGDSAATAAASSQAARREQSQDQDQWDSTMQSTYAQSYKSSSRAGRELAAEA